MVYGAVIASFLGGIRWGLVAAEPDEGRVTLDYVLAVVPSLLAWAELALPPAWDLQAGGALILLWGLVDQELIRRGLAPAWLGRCGSPSRSRRRHPSARGDDGLGELDARGRHAARVDRTPPR